MSEENLGHKPEQFNMPEETGKWELTDTERVSLTGHEVQEALAHIENVKQRAGKEINPRDPLCKLLAEKAQRYFQPVVKIEL
jgi:hypothetical protein